MWDRAVCSLVKLSGAPLASKPSYGRFIKGLCLLLKKLPQLLLIVSSDIMTCFREMDPDNISDIYCGTRTYVRRC